MNEHGLSITREFQAPGQRKSSGSLKERLVKADGGVLFGAFLCVAGVAGVFLLGVKKGEGSTTAVLYAILALAVVAYAAALVVRGQGKGNKREYLSAADFTGFPLVPREQANEILRSYRAIRDSRAVAVGDMDTDLLRMAHSTAWHTLVETLGTRELHTTIALARGLEDLSPELAAAEQAAAAISARAGETVRGLTDIAAKVARLDAVIVERDRLVARQAQLSDIRSRLARASGAEVSSAAAIVGQDTISLLAHRIDVLIELRERELRIARDAD
ncbi:hypothetical protein [Actinokineospora globicatena]|uniref:hypothetical protein n=1 Tax=Actinokineospora globicatena TaxID=103729 RepID=UPI0020A403F1|nr:hypothetical protein [Actinokineospora globicatena]MCP2306491.1 hypothetical protein [Actinokineospora globicatena]GLW81920.1 hypothetical protein Aglo01_64010 [Actinokineospora globicatena]GLW88714.1 hypothetical protein Aglo02_63530 [Actinokineospora globicatena]